MTNLLLAIAYALIAALLLNIWISTRWATPIKVSIVLCVGLFYAGTYIGIRNIEGWATEEQLPESFRLVWAKTVEPDKRTGTDGQIYLWVQSLDEEGIIDDEPRAYKLPFSIQLAEKIQDALGKSEKGAEVDGKMSHKVDDVAADGQQIINDQETNLTYFKEKGIIIEFKQRPRRTLPSKGV